MPMPWEEYQKQPARLPWQDYQAAKVNPATNQPSGGDEGRDSLLGKADAFMRGAADTLTLGTADEIAAGLGTGFGYLGDYDKELARQRGIDEADADDRFGYRLGGQLGGGLVGGAGLVKAGLSPTAGAIKAGWKLPLVAGTSAAEGGVLSAAHGFGSGEGAEDRVSKAKSEGVMGAGIGGFAPFATAGLSKVVSGILGKSAMNSVAKSAPSREELKATTDSLYGAMREAGITYDPTAFGSSIQGAKDEMLKVGLRPSVAGDAFSYLDDLAKMKAAPDFDDINGLVQTVGEARRAADRAGNGPLAKAYGIIRDHLDDFEANAPLTSAKNMDRATLNGTRQAARQTALKNIKARTLDNILTNAETYQGGMESGIRNQIGSLLRSAKGKQLFTGPERTALLAVSQGRKGLQTLSRFGFDLTSLGGNATFLPALGAVGVGSGFGAPAGGALAAAGTAAKYLSPRMTQKALENAAAAIRSGKLDAETVSRQLPPQLRGMLNAMLTQSGSAAGRAVTSP